MIDRRMAFSGWFAAVLTPLLRQFWMILLIVTVGTMAALAYGRMQLPKFEARAVVQVRPGVDVAAAKADLTSRRNLLAMVMRHNLASSDAGANLERAAVLLRQAVAVQDLSPDGGRAQGVQPEVLGIVVSVLLPDAETAARVANDLAQQVLDRGAAGMLDVDQPALEFYRREEARLWQETSSLQAEITGRSPGIALEGDGTALLDLRRLTLLRDQYDLVRAKLAEAEVDARRRANEQAGQFSLLQRATATEAVTVVQNWMLVGVAGSLLLAVALAFVLDRRYPGVPGGPWAGRVYRVLDDPARPVLGVPRYMCSTVLVVVGLVSLAALLR